jgi:glutaconate CoA-transferase subunit B
MSPERERAVIALLASLLKDAGVVACGSSSPVPAAAALLAEQLFPGTVEALIFRNNVNDPFHESGSELYDRIAQGRIDVFFLSGAQIDRQANLNNVGIGPYPHLQRRFPGSFGAPFVHFMVPRVILFREEHSRRTLVERVDFVSAAGLSPPEVHRPGGPTDLVTGRAHFRFDRERGGFILVGMHSGETIEGLVENTGFAFDLAEQVEVTPQLSGEWNILLQGPVRERLAETYPEFTKERL